MLISPLSPKAIVDNLQFWQAKIAHNVHYSQPGGAKQQADSAQTGREEIINRDPNKSGLHRRG
jgi:hypothetical protein